MMQMGFGLKMLFVTEMQEARQHNVSLLVEAPGANSGLLHRNLSLAPETYKPRESDRTWIHGIESSSNVTRFGLAVLRRDRWFAGTAYCDRGRHGIIGYGEGFKSSLVSFGAKNLITSR